MRDKRRFTRDAYEGTSERVRGAGGDTSFAGRQHIKKTGKLHELVDPAGFGVIRRSLPRYTGDDSEGWTLPNGMPMPVENLFDTTGSMGRNVELAFKALPDQYDLLANGEQPVLGRYDVHIANAIFGDVVDDFVLARTQYEMDEKIAEQLTLMVPEGQGGDGPEDPEYGLFGAAYLTAPFILKYGLKPYHFMTTDATSHGRTSREGLVRVFGEQVFDKMAENGHFVHLNPTTSDIVSDLKGRAHAFALIVGGGAVGYWEKYYGKEHVISIDSTSHLHFVEAAVIGLTEGVLSLSSLAAYLTKVGCSTEAAREIQRAVAGIPLRAQAILPNFAKIPLKGSVFEKKHDLWPMEERPVRKKKKTGTDENAWL